MYEKVSSSTIADSVRDYILVEAIVRPFEHDELEKWQFLHLYTCGVVMLGHKIRTIYMPSSSSLGI